MDCAPKTGERILILTGDFGIVEAWWSEEHFDFYAELSGEALIGEWVCGWPDGDGERRLFCGATPHFWKPIGKLPKADKWGTPGRWTVQPA